MMRKMSELIVAGFNGQHTADQVLLDLFKMEQIHLVDLDDAAVAIRKKDGTIAIKHTSILVMADAALGSGCGLLIGTVCLNPLMGTLVGGVVGAAVGGIIKVVKKGRFHRGSGGHVKARQFRHLRPGAQGAPRQGG